MTNRLRIAAALLVFAALTTLPGCVSNASGPGPEGTSYTLGHLDGPLAATPQKIVEAAKAVLHDQEINIVSEAATGLDGKIVGRTALDTQIHITVKRQDDKNSKISIQVGTWGDAQLSRDLYTKIKAKI